MSFSTIVESMCSRWFMKSRLTPGKSVLTDTRFRRGERTRTRYPAI